MQQNYDVAGSQCAFPPPLCLYRESVCVCVLKYANIKFRCVMIYELLLLHCLDIYSLTGCQELKLHNHMKLAQQKQNTK